MKIWQVQVSNGNGFQVRLLFTDYDAVEEFEYLACSKGYKVSIPPRFEAFACTSDAEEALNQCLPLLGEPE